MNTGGWRYVLLAVPMFVAPMDGVCQAERLDGRISPRAAAEVSALADSARALSLPVEPLIQKALEGASKGATTEEIIGAAHGLLRDMALSRDALGAGAPEHSLVLAAAALDLGASATDISRLRPHTAHPSLSPALGGLLYLLGRNVPTGESVDLTLEMLGADLPAAAFHSLQRLVEQDTRQGALPVESARVRARALIRAGGPLGLDGGGIR